MGKDSGMKKIMNLQKVGKMVKVPLVSEIKIVDGKLVYEIEDYIDTPAEWLGEEPKKGQVH